MGCVSNRPPMTRLPPPELACTGSVSSRLLVGDDGSLCLWDDEAGEAGETAAADAPAEETKEVSAPAEG